MRILLINPPFYRFIGFYNRYFPIGLAGLGAVLRDAGHEVVVYDADCNDKPRFMDYTRLPEQYPRYLARLARSDDPILTEVRETLRRIDPELIGISIWTTYAASAFRVAEIARELFPDRPIVMGGPHATARADEVLRIAPAVDYVVRGEGERTILELVRRLETAGGDPASIPGVSCRENGRVRHGPARENCRDLDEFPIPDRKLLMNGRKYTPEDMGLIMTSRGCPFSCTFCATETRQIRYHSIPRILGEIRQVKADFGTTQFSFKDDSFTVNKSRVIEFCDALEREDRRIEWECTTRVDLVDEDLALRMKRAGCNGVKLGIESGSESVLERMNKGITLEQARTAAALFRRVGIHWTGYFLIGTPGETLEDVQKTLGFMYEIEPDFASIGVYEPFPGTALFAEGLRRGLVKAHMTLEDFFATLPNNYYKAGGRQVDTMDTEAFARLEKEMKARFHAYNKNMVRLLKRAKSRAGLYLSRPTALVADVRKYLSWC